MKTHEIFLVEWVDSRQPVGSWHHIDDWDIASACKCVSVGYLIKDDSSVKALAQNMADIDNEDLTQASGVITIPNECIKTIRKMSN